MVRDRWGDRLKCRPRLWSCYPMTSCWNTFSLLFLWRLRSIFSLLHAFWEVLYWLSHRTSLMHTQTAGLILTSWLPCWAVDASAQLCVFLIWNTFRYYQRALSICWSHQKRNRRCGDFCRSRFCALLLTDVELRELGFVYSPKVRVGNEFWHRYSCSVCKSCTSSTIKQ